MKAVSQPKLHAPVRHLQSLPLKALSFCYPTHLSFPPILPMPLEHPIWGFPFARSLFILSSSCSPILLCPDMHSNAVHVSSLCIHLLIHSTFIEHLPYTRLFLTARHSLVAVFLLNYDLSLQRNSNLLDRFFFSASRTGPLYLQQPAHRKWSVNGLGINFWITLPFYLIHSYNT